MNARILGGNDEKGDKLFRVVLFGGRERAGLRQPGFVRMAFSNWDGCRMSLYKMGHLTREMIEIAKESFQQRILPNGEPMKLLSRIDVLPPPREEGDRIFGLASLKEYRAVTIGDGLQWKSTGKTLVDYMLEEKKHAAERTVE